MVKFKWACPECGAEPHSHGKGGAEECQERNSPECQGFLCECSDPGDSATHGEIGTDPCPEAHCYHCNWGGIFPPIAASQTGWPTWAKTEFKAGWVPKAGWAP